MSNYKYQLVQLGYLSKYPFDLKKEFLSAVEELNLPKASFEFINHSNFDAKFKKNQPCFGIYYGDVLGNQKHLKYVQVLLDAGVPVLPIFNDSFSTEIPGLLENQNGLKFEPHLVSKIVNLCLESFGLLRSTRKVFISYKRNESSSVAIQLYEALERNNFDCFLDTHSIKQGEPFQEELWHRMTDCDVIVLLNTPGFLTSRWCKEEIAEAGVKKIGVVQLIWPEHKLAATDEVCYPFPLTKSNFESEDFNNAKTSRLNENTVSQIIHEVESLRARNLASRRDDLITEFLNVGKAIGRKMEVQPQRFITESLPNNKRKLFVPSIGIPRSFDCHQSEEIMKEIAEYEIENLYLIYDDLRIRDKWLNHLDWLNGYLEIRTLKKQKFEEWLKNN